MKDESDCDTSCNWCTWYIHQRIAREIGGLGNNRASGDDPNDKFVEIGQNTKKSLGSDLLLANSVEKKSQMCKLQNCRLWCPTYTQNKIERM